MKHISPLVKALILILSFFNIHIISSQHHGDDELQACPIQMPDLPDQINLFGHPRNINNSHCKTNGISWSTPLNARHSDDEYVDLELDGLQTSDCLYFSDFQLNIPEGAYIEGIELWVEGHRLGDNISELKIKLTNQNGEPISASKAKTSRQKPWDQGGFGDDKIWHYGARDDTWGKDWSSDLLNSQGFGVSLQLAQKKDSTHTLIRIDQVRLKVHYVPLPVLCNDSSNIFIVQPLSIACSFIWDLPIGAYINSANPNLNTITVNIEDLSDGIHEICVRTLTLYGLSDPCCMKFIKGDCSTSSVGNLVWLDNNINGIQDPIEKGMNNIPVKLYSATSKRIIRDTFTDSLGFYQFHNIPEGHYYLEYTPPTDYQASIRFATTTDNDNDVFKVNNRFITNPFFLKGSSTKYDQDAGFNDGTINSGRIGNFVWADRDNDGIQDRFENGVNDILVSLYKRNGVLVDSQKTQNDSFGKPGFYEFIDIQPGEYYIHFEESQNYNFAKNLNINQNLNSDVTHKYKHGSTDLITIKKGTFLDNIDAGILQISSLGNYVWNDEDRNGIQGISESGINGIQIRLYNQNREFVDSTFTMHDSVSNNDGYYIFKDLLPNGYYIKINKPNNYRFSPFNIGNDDSKDSDINNSNGFGSTFIFHLASGAIEKDIDCGLFMTSTIGNLVWDDINADGIQDSSELGIKDVLIKLYNSTSKELINETLTDNTGHYQFSELMDTSYFLEFFPPSDHVVSNRFTTTEDLDNDVHLVNNRFLTDEISVTVGRTIMNIDGGFTNVNNLFGNIGNRIWIDRDNDGIQDGFEEGKNDVLVSLYKSNGILVDAILSQNDSLNNPGYYEFKDIEKGEYFIVFEASANYNFTSANAKNNDARDSDVTGAQMNGSTDIFTLNGGDNLNTIDAGLILISSVGDLVWEDENNNGIQDASEDGMNNIRVLLYDDNYHVVDSTITKYNTSLDQNGYFLFDNLMPGGYYVLIEKPDGYEFSVSNIGGNDVIDSDINNSNGPNTSFIFYLSGGEHERDIDGGLYKTSSLGSLVWNDENKNGMKDDDEDGVNNVLVEIFDIDGTKIKQTHSNDKGEYLIDEMAQGSYFMKFHPPLGYGFTKTIKSHPHENSDVDHQNGYGTTQAFNIDVNQQLMHIDAGMRDDLILAIFFERFNAIWTNETVNLDWTIDDAQDVNRFVIMRKENGEDRYSEIDQVVMTSIMKMDNKFHYQDYNAIKGKRYHYFIISIEEDDTQINSSIQSIQIPKNINEGISCYPNPVNDIFTISLTNPTESLLKVKIFNILGLEISKAPYEVEGEDILINVTSLLNGHYIIKIEGEGIHQIISMIVKH